MEIAQKRSFRTNVPMMAILGTVSVLALATVYGVAGMSDRKDADKDAAAAARVATVPENLLQAAPLDPGPAPVVAKEVVAAAPVQLAPSSPPTAPTIEQMARANAGAAAWQAYFATLADIEKKRVEAISEGLISPVQAKIEVAATAAPGAGAGGLPRPDMEGFRGGMSSPGGGGAGMWAAADSKQSWANQPGMTGVDYLPSVRHGPASEYAIMAGTTISATTKGGMISDAPGRIVGQIDRDVFCNTPAGGVCIPQGSTLILTYDTRVSQGECRMVVAAERLLFPDATSMSLGRMVVGDASGYAGLEDECETHLGERLLTAVLFTGVQGIFQLGSSALGSNNVSGQAVQSVARDEAMDGMRIPPTLRIRPGAQFSVILPKDLLFTEPYTFRNGDEDE